MSLNNIFFTNRIIGAGFFANGGVNQPKFALRENTNYLDILKIALGYLEFWDDILKQKDVKCDGNFSSFSFKVKHFVIFL